MQHKIIKVLKFIFYLIMLIVAWCAKLLPKYRNVWIISERGFDASDNGWHLFNYIMDQPDRPKIFYIISKDSEDRKRLNGFSNVICRGSFKHWLYFALADVKISTHIMGYAPDIYFFMWIDRFNLVFGKKVFLQHGVIYNNILGLHYPAVKIDLFVCGANPEYKFITENFKHPNNVVQYLGLCRFDNLINNKPQKILLIMPTWRSWLSSCRDNNDFKSTEYYKRYNNLISSPELLRILEEYDYKLIFYPHYEMQKFIHSFSSKNRRIIIANKEDFDVQQLLKTTSLLITDYSSVFFDFAYMKKPLLLYQFDSEKFYESHYHKGYINSNNNPFGKSYAEEKKLIDAINVTIQNNCKITLDVDKSVNKYFVKYDADNCKRNFEAILKLVQ